MVICLRSSVGQVAGKLASPVTGGSVGVAVEVLDDEVDVNAEGLAVGTEPLVLFIAPMKAFPLAWGV